MSIRTRLIILCIVVALLPAIPLSLAVRSLIDKSFNIGLSSTVDEALQNGVVISREHLDALRDRFEADVERIIRQHSQAGGVITREYVKGHNSIVESVFHMRAPAASAPVVSMAVPKELGPFRRDPQFASLVGRERIITERAATASSSAAFAARYYETEDRLLQLAFWNRHLFYTRLDPSFFEKADRVLEGRQIFAELQLKRPGLRESFFLPFVVIYSIIVILSLILATFFSERLAKPIRQLVDGTKRVAGGDWDYRHETKTGGEIGRLEKAFNMMVSRLDNQKRRLVDMERMATWRNMARHLAHEIKNPLLPIRLTIQELRDQYGGDDKHYQEMLTESTRVVEDELDHLKKLVKEFSSFARMPDMAPRIADLHALTSDVAKLYPGIDTKFELDQSLSSFRFDPDQLRLVLVNLFDNVLTIMAPLQTPPRVIITTLRSAELVELRFADNGPGMAPDIVDKIFDPYFTTRDEGTGLGLAMVKNIVLLHNGTIRVESTRGKGAIFIIALPFVTHT